MIEQIVLPQPHASLRWKKPYVAFFVFKLIVLVALFYFLTDLRFLVRVGIAIFGLDNIENSNYLSCILMKIIFSKKIYQS